MKDGVSKRSSRLFPLLSRKSDRLSATEFNLQVLYLNSKSNCASRIFHLINLLEGSVVVKTQFKDYWSNFKTNRSYIKYERRVSRSHATEIHSRSGSL